MRLLDRLEAEDCINKFESRELVFSVQDLDTLTTLLYSLKNIGYSIDVDVKEYANDMFAGGVCTYVMISYNNFNDHKRTIDFCTTNSRTKCSVDFFDAMTIVDIDKRLALILGLLGKDFRGYEDQDYIWPQFKYNKR